MSQVARALADIAAFLEFSGDDVLDPDAAVKTMKQIEHDLSLLGEEDYAALASVCTYLASEARVAGPRSNENVEFYETFLEKFGVTTAMNR